MPYTKNIFSFGGFNHYHRYAKSGNFKQIQHIRVGVPWFPAACWPESRRTNLRGLRKVEVTFWGRYFDLYAEFKSASLLYVDQYLKGTNLMLQFVETEWEMHVSLSV
jgi:hypothetical protein